jgi:hypothetical protein
MVTLRALRDRLIAIYLSLTFPCILFPFAKTAWYFRQQECKVCDSLSPFDSLSSLGLLDHALSERFTFPTFERAHGRQFGRFHWNR